MELLKSSKSEHTRQGHLNTGKSCHLGAAEGKAPSSLVAQHCHFQVRVFDLNIFRLGLSPEYSQKKLHQGQQIVVIVCVRKMDHIYFDKV